MKTEKEWNEKIKKQSMQIVDLFMKGCKKINKETPLLRDSIMHSIFVICLHTLVHNKKISLEAIMTEIDLFAMRLKEEVATEYQQPKNKD